MSGKVDLARLYTLLVVWLILLIAPGALEVLGVFGPLGVDSLLGGAIVGLWIVGYLAQFAVFMWISRIVDPGFPAWFAASSLPWAIDWTTPLSPWIGCIWVVIAVAFALYIASHARRDESLREHGVHATGTVLQVYQPFMNVIVNNAYIKRKMRLRVEGLPNVAPYEAEFNGLFMFGNVPSVGDKIPLLVDPHDPQRFEYDDSSTSGDSLTDDLSSTANGRTSAQDGSTSFSDDSSANIAEHLGRLAELHQQGALSDTEFDAAKKKLLA